MTALPKTDIVAVIGAGAMGAGIAQVAASAGHTVLLYDARIDAARAGQSGILGALGRQVDKGKLPAAELDAIAGRIRVAGAMDDLRDARLVVEAIAENLEVKRSLFAQLERVVPSDTILATNTSSLSVTAIAAGLDHPERVAGMHFFNPAPVMRLVEVVSGLATSPSVLQQLHDTASAWGKSPVRATSTPGFIVNRVARPYYAEALRMFEERVAAPVVIDAILRESGGFRMGPFALMDLIGHDVNFAVTRSVFEAFFGDPRYRPSLIQQELVAAGWLGRKSGRGFFDYADGAAPPAPESAPPEKAPNRVIVEGDLGPAQSLIDCFEASGVIVDRRAGKGLIHVGQACLGLGDGCSATERVAAGGPLELVHFDLALDYASAERIALAPAAQSSPEALAAATGLFQHLGKQVSVIKDSPGMIVFRTVAMLANEALEAVLTGVATPADIDRAMELGVNYPIGPLSWADRLGPARVLEGLDAIHAATGDPRYRASRLFRHNVSAGLGLT
jgi:3-hydroxybutyryl-CoA dehydrogenase